jgi:hypothetical protein
MSSHRQRSSSGIVRKATSNAESAASVSSFRWRAYPVSAAHHHSAAWHARAVRSAAARSPSLTRKPTRCPAIQSSPGRLAPNRSSTPSAERRSASRSASRLSHGNSTV